MFWVGILNLALLALQRMTRPGRCAKVELLGGVRRHAQVGEYSSSLAVVAPVRRRKKATGFQAQLGPGAQLRIFPTPPPPGKCSSPT